MPHLRSGHSTAWSRLRFWTLRKTTPPAAHADREPGRYVPTPDDYPVYPPPRPSAILADPAAYLAKVQAIKFAAPQGEFEDKPLYAFYRLYELVVLDHVIGYRNQLEYIWRQRAWPVHDIPDPHDDDPERYAFLAGCALLLVRSFNARVKLGLTRDLPSLMTPDEAEAARSRPDHERPYETAPEWALRVPPLAETLAIPTSDGVLLDGKEDPRACPEFLTKNILLWTPHIYFT